MKKNLAMVFIYGCLSIFLVSLWQIEEQKKQRVLAKEVSAPAPVTHAAVAVATAKPTQAPISTPKPKRKKKYKYHLSKSERRVLERIIEAEAGGQGLRGKILVGNVVMNRVRQSAYPDTVKGVVYARLGSCYQFSPVGDGRIDTVRVTKETKRAVEKVLKGVDYSRGAQYFMCRRTASAKNRRWFDRHLDRLFTYGGHEFFRK